MDEYTRLYNLMMENIVKEKGGSIALYNNLINKIAYLESGLDPTIKQTSGGPGRGKYQMETGVGYEKVYEDGKHKAGHFKGTSNRIYYSAVRAKNYLRTLGQKVPKEIENIITNGTGDASQLNETLQDILAIGDLRMGPVNLKDYADGKITGKDIYINNWWAGKDQNHREKLSKRWDDKDEDFKNTSKYIKDDFKQELNQNIDKNKFISDKPVMVAESTNALYNPSSKTKNEFKPIKIANGADKQQMQESFMELIGNKAAQNQKAMGGDLNEFRGGGTHSQNPLGGIPQGIGINGKLNTVEEDETSYDFKEGRFIFSNRIII